MKEKGVELEKLKTEFDNYKARNIVVVLERVVLQVSSYDFYNN